MSALWTLDIKCDGEDCFEWDSGAGERTLTKVRKYLKPIGWSTVNHQGKIHDLCPSCTEKQAKLKCQVRSDDKSLVKILSEAKPVNIFEL